MTGTVVKGTIQLVRLRPDILSDGHRSASLAVLQCWGQATCCIVYAPVSQTFLTTNNNISPEREPQDSEENKKYFTQNSPAA